MRFLLSFRIFFLINVAAGYKFLLYSPKFGKSHMNFVGRIADTLAKANHEVVVYQPIYDENITTTGTKLARVIERPRDFEAPFTLDQMQPDVWMLQEPGFSDLMKIGDRLSSSFTTLCKHQLGDKEMLSKLKNEKFDLALGEAFDTCYYGILEMIGMENYITIMPGAMFPGGWLGIPSTPSFLPGMMTTVPPPFTYLERAKNVLSEAVMNLFVSKVFGPMEETIRPFAGKNFNVIEKLGNSAFLFVNGEEHAELPRPISHKIIYIGGLGQAKPQPLEKKYQEIMENSKKGVILVSFGSVAQSSKMPEEMKKVFLETFKKFPDITFVWKYEKEEDNIAKGYENVVTSSWVPQTDLLEHPKLLAFITHGGINSIMEGSFSGVPMICIPLFGDQRRNSVLLKYRKTGFLLEKMEIMEGKLERAIKTIIGDENYRKNAKRMSALIKAKPMTAEERTIKYTEFAAQFGNDNNLDMYGRHMNFLQFYCLDIIIPFFIIIFFFVYLIYRLLRFVVRKVVYFVSKKEKDE